MTLGVAVIGTGAAGNYHIRCYAKNPRTRLVGIWGRERSLSRMRELQREYGVEMATTNLDEILSRDDIQIVSLCTPNHHHAEQAIRAMRAGKHVLCESPMVTRSQDAAEVARVARETGRVFMVGEIGRYEPVFANIKRMCVAGEVGRIWFAGSDFWVPEEPEHLSRPGWWGREADNPEFALFGFGFFSIDLLRWVGGEILEVTAYGARNLGPDVPFHDTITVNLRFASGAVGRMGIVQTARRPYNWTLSIYGSEGTVENNQVWFRKLLPCAQAEMIELPIPLVKWEPRFDRETEAMFAAEINDLVSAVEQGRQAPIDAVEGLRDTLVLEAIMRSMQTGQSTRVELPEEK